MSICRTHFFNMCIGIIFCSIGHFNFSKKKSLISKTCCEFLCWFKGCAKMTSRIGGSNLGGSNPGGNWKHAHGTGHYGRNFSIKWLKVHLLCFPFQNSIYIPMIKSEFNLFPWLSFVQLCWTAFCFPSLLLPDLTSLYRF